MSKPPRKRASRARKPAWQFTGLNLADWQTEPSRVLWAQTSAEFKELFTVLVNERRQALAGRTGSESRLLGIMEGYELALSVVASMSVGALGEPAPEPEPYEHVRSEAAERQEQFIA